MGIGLSATRNMLAFCCVGRSTRKSMGRTSYKISEGLQQTAMQCSVWTCKTHLSCVQGVGGGGAGAGCGQGHQQLHRGSHVVIQPPGQDVCHRTVQPALPAHPHHLCPPPRLTIEANTELTADTELTHPIDFGPILQNHFEDRTRLLGSGSEKWFFRSLHELSTACEVARCRIACASAQQGVECVCAHQGGAGTPG